MKIVVLTGGPCSGKSTIQHLLKAKFGDLVVPVPEAATVLLSGGFPVPGRDLAWSPEWQASFQSAVLSLQQSLEGVYRHVGHQKGSRLLICDRGLLDGAAYTPGGVESFSQLYGVDIADALSRYDQVIHLESVATCNPVLYGQIGNASRFEPLAEAQALEHAVRDVWVQHPRRVFFGGDVGIDGQLIRVIQTIERLLVSHV